MSENHPSIKSTISDTGSDVELLAKARRELAESLAWLVVRAIGWIGWLRRFRTQPFCDRVSDPVNE